MTVELPDAIVLRRDDVDVVRKDPIGHSPEQFKRDMILMNDGRPADVSAGDDKRSVCCIGQQCKHGRVWQYDARPLQSRSDGILRQSCFRAVITKRTEYDRSCLIVQCLHNDVIQSDIPGGRLRIGIHDGKGFERAVFSFPQFHDAVFRRRIADQEIATYPFHGHDPAFSDEG